MVFKGHFPNIPPDAEYKALMQDVSDIVERMKVAYKDNPTHAAGVLANALGTVIAEMSFHAEDDDPKPCMQCMVKKLADHNAVMAMQAAHTFDAMIRDYIERNS